MVQSPCQNCPNRTIPKDCENECLMWNIFQIEKEKEKKIVREQKALEKRLDQCIWRGRNDRQRNRKIH